MGGKSSSSSSSTQETINETTQASVDGVAGGHILQGQSVNFTEQFSPEVRAAFGELIDLVGDSLDLVGKAGEAIVKSGDNAVSVVAATKESVTQPELAALSKLIPILTLVAGGVIVWLIFKKRG